MCFVWLIRIVVKKKKNCGRESLTSNPHLQGPVDIVGVLSYRLNVTAMHTQVLGDGI